MTRFERPYTPSLVSPADLVSPPVLERFEPPGPVAVVVARILRVCFSHASMALDLTPGRGNFWREDVPIGVTVESSPHDFRCLPYANDSFDVTLFDPPHLADAGARSVMAQRYGTYKQADLEPAIRCGAREA